MSTTKKYRTQWQCDICNTAKFDTYDEALEHEQNCLGVNNGEALEHDEQNYEVIIDIGYEEGKILGFLLCYRNNNPSTIYLSPKSSVLTLSHYIKTSVARELLCLSTWDDIDDAFLHNLREFGQNNIPPVQARRGITPRYVKDINGDCLKAVLTGKIRPRHIIKTVQYNKNNMVCISDNHSSSDDLADILSCRESYPIKLTLQHVASSTKVSEPQQLNDISQLDLSNNILIDRIGWDRLLEGLIKLEHVTEIDLSNSNIGRDGCVALVSLLERDSSSLASLSLRQNQIDDECITLLCGGLQNNESLISLDIEHNPRITKAGWECLSALVCNTTDINSTYYSNHTLQSMGISLGDMVDNREDLPLDLLAVLNDVNINLDINENKTDAARCKLWNTHFEVGVFDLHQFLDMDIRIIPRVIAWLSIDDPDEEFACMTAIYHFIRNWDVPVLFGFPSAESLRIGKRMEELEKLVESLKKENRHVHELRVENEALRKEIQVLKNDESTTAGGSETLKRRRTNV